MGQSGRRAGPLREAECQVVDRGAGCPAVLPFMTCVVFWDWTFLGSGLLSSSLRLVLASERRYRLGAKTQCDGTRGTGKLGACTSVSDSALCS